MGAVLIVAPSWVGDMVMAQSLFKVLKVQNAERAIDVLAPGWTLALLERMPEVRDAIEMPLGHGQLRLMMRRRLGVSLRAAGYEQAILLPNSFKSALIPYWARIPWRTGYVEGTCSRTFPGNQ
jgi:heptosyltransferase-2